MGRHDTILYSRHPEWYDKDGFHRLPVLELDSSRSVTPGVYGIDAKAQSVGSEGAPGYLCPAPIEPELTRKLQRLAYRAHVVLGALDISRTDVRLDAEGQPRLIEINTLPGLTPNYSDLCIQAAAEGVSYEDLILEILYLGASRWGLLPARDLSPYQRKKVEPPPGKTNGNGKPADGKQIVSGEPVAKTVA
jgi:D-alanine-D-alanine ligase